MFTRSYAKSSVLQLPILFLHMIANRFFRRRPCVEGAGCTKSALAV